MLSKPSRSMALASAGISAHGTSCRLASVRIAASPPHHRHPITQASV
jgi:hypothetical protein